MSSKKTSSNNGNPNSSKNNQPISAKKADKLARKQARQEALEAMKNPSKKGYWSWERIVLVFITFVVLFGFVFYTFLPILFR